VKAVGFDADGVLVDSREAAWRAAERVLRLFGAAHAIASYEAMEAAFGPAAQKALVGEQHASVLRMAHRLLMRRWAPSIGIFDQAVTAVAGLSAPRILITAALADGIGECLGVHAALFSEIVGFERGRKPDLLAALAPRLAVYVTDSSLDIEDCKAVGVPTIGCAWGYEPLAVLRHARPHAIALRPADLPALITPFMTETMQ
jgi:phosphoglycolate phosphatase-like HAD superfamily hydrolase